MHDPWEVIWKECVCERERERQRQRERETERERKRERDRERERERERQREREREASVTDPNELPVSALPRTLHQRSMLCTIRLQSIDCSLLNNSNSDGSKLERTCSCIPHRDRRM